MQKNRIRNIILLVFFIVFSITMVFRNPIKVFVRDQVPEIAYLRLSWIKNIITGKRGGN